MLNVCAEWGGGGGGGGEARSDGEGTNPDLGLHAECSDSVLGKGIPSAG